MPAIKHIGITAEDPAAVGRFYMDVFGFIEVSSGDDSMVVSDGNINVTILKFKEDVYGGGRPGIHHFGIQVGDFAETSDKLRSTDSKELVEINRYWNEEYVSRFGLERLKDGRVKTEVKWVTPDGVLLDISESGWDTN